MKIFTFNCKQVLALVLFLICSGLIAVGQTTQNFTTSGTWTAPAGVTSIQVEAWGGGGGGGGSTNTAGNIGGGGGGGAYARRATVNITAGTTYTITVGAAGAAGTNGGANGQTGGTSTATFGGVTITAAGGAGGITNTGGSGAGGTVASSSGDVGAVFAGGSGAAGASGNGGGGGGGAGSTGAGNSGVGTTGGAARANNGGAGGNGTANASAFAGSIYGGGGGGAGSRNNNGGAGAPGLITLTYTCPTLTVSAGANQTLATCATTTTLSGSAVPSGMTGTWTIVSGTATITTPSSPTSTVTGLTLGTTATLRWTVSNGVCGSSSSDMTITTSRGPGCWEYCSASGSSSTVGFIKNVNFNSGGINRTSAYDGYINTGLTTTVVQGAAYPLSITRTANSGYPMFVSAWIDYNNDGDFADAGEQIFLSTSNSTAGDITYTPSITIPAGAVTGTTRMRVLSKYSTTPTATGCDVSTYNDVEDYSITIVASGNCSGTPTAGTITPATSTITTAQSATLSWSELPLTGLTYQWQSSSSTSGPWTNISGANSATYTASGLSGGIHYFRLIITCSNSGLSATSATAQVTVTLVYCTPHTTNCTPNLTGGCGVQNMVITNVTFGTLNNSSSTNSCGTNGYTDYSSTVAAPTFTIGLTYNFSITVGTTTCGTNSAMVWFDFNQNGVFGDAGEGYSLGTVTSGATITIPVQIPTGATVGTTRMRIRYLYNTSVLSSHSCSSSSNFGETEDYSLTLSCGTTPSDVTGKFPANNVPLACGSAATLGWNSHTCATGYKVFLGTNNPPTTLVSTQTSTSYYTGNLASNTTYYWRVVPYSSNGDGASSTWSFTTQTAIVTAISQDASGCTDNGLTLIASGGAYPDYYWYDVPVGGQPIASGTTFTPTGLTQPTTYYVSNVLMGPANSINTGTTSGIVCSNTTAGFGNMFDIQAKTANLSITGVAVMFRDLGTTGNPPQTRSVKVYYRTTSYVGNATSSAGWNLIFSNASFPVPSSPTGPTQINFPTVLVPAGMTYGIYIVYDNAYDAGANVYANADIEVRTGSSICGAEFSGEIADRSFRGTVYYSTSCSSPTISVVATPWVSSASVKLATTSVTGLIERCTESGWTYYATSAAPNDWLIAINKNGNTFTAAVSITKQSAVNSNINASGQHGSFLLPRYWNATLTSGSIDPTRPVSVRFFLDTAEIRATINARDAAHLSYPTTYKTPWRWFKTVNTVFNPAVGIDGNQFNFTNVTTTPTATLTIGGIGTYTGRINNVAYVDLGGITSFSGGTGGLGFNPFNAPLPIELLSFTAVPQQDIVKLNWSTATEINNSHFTIQRTSDGENFEDIIVVNGAGNSNSLKNYVSYDKNPLSGSSFYRLLQTDFDGTTTKSELVAVNMGQNVANAHIAPNPVNNRMDVTYTSIQDGDVMIYIYDATGKVVDTFNKHSQKGVNMLNFDVERYSTGLYHITFIQDGNIIKRKFLKQ